MSNKGFTLIELLAVIVILSIIMTIVIINTAPVVNDARNKLTEIQISKIEEAAKFYYMQEGMSEEDYKEYNFKSCINLDELIEKGYFDTSKIKDFEDNSELTGHIIVKYASNNYTYEYNEGVCEFEGKPLEICELVSDADNSKTITAGDKYKCEVNEGTNFNFYVLSLEKDNINLIMERNICDDGTVATAQNTCLTSWMNKKDYEEAGGLQRNSSEDNDDSYYGPVTAMNYLYSATKSWDNVPNIVMSYEDEIYGGIKTTGVLTQIINYNDEIVKVNKTENGYTNLKARIPMKSELSDYSASSNNAHLYDNLELDDRVHEQGMAHIDGIVGYWSISSSYADCACGIAFDGILDCGNLVAFGLGVRPVITITTDNIK